MKQILIGLVTVLSVQANPALAIQQGGCTEAELPAPFKK